MRPIGPRTRACGISIKIRIGKDVRDDRGASEREEFGSIQR